MTHVGVYKYGMADRQPATGDVSGAANGAVTTNSAHVSRMGDKDNPALWLLGIGAVTLGFIAFSTSVRVGNVRGSVSAGTP